MLRGVGIDVRALGDQDLARGLFLRQRRPASERAADPGLAAARRAGDIDARAARQLDPAGRDRDLAASVGDLLARGVERARNLHAAAVAALEQDPSADL